MHNKINSYLISKVVNICINNYSIVFHKHRFQGGFFSAIFVFSKYFDFPKTIRNIVLYLFLSNVLQLLDSQNLISRNTFLFQISSKSHSPKSNLIIWFTLSTPNSYDFLEPRISYGYSFYKFSLVLSFFSVYKRNEFQQTLNNIFKLEI